MSVRYRNQFDSVTIIYDHCESTTNILTNIAIILSSEYKQTKGAFLITGDIDVSDKPSVGPKPMLVIVAGLSDNKRCVYELVLVSTLNCW